MIKKKLYRLIAQWLHFTNVLQCWDRFYFFFQVFDPDNNHQFFLNISKPDNHWFWFGEKNQNLEEGDHSGYFRNLKELAIFRKELRVIKAVILSAHNFKNTNLNYNSNECWSEGTFNKLRTQVETAFTTNNGSKTSITTASKIGFLICPFFCILPSVSAKLSVLVLSFANSSVLPKKSK